MAAGCARSGGHSHPAGAPRIFQGLGGKGLGCNGKCGLVGGWEGGCGWNRQQHRYMPIGMLGFL
jgi:hypothetical protein